MVGIESPQHSVLQGERQRPIDRRQACPCSAVVHVGTRFERQEENHFIYQRNPLARLLGLLRRDVILIELGRLARVAIQTVVLLDQDRGIHLLQVIRRTSHPFLTLVRLHESPDPISSAIGEEAIDRISAGAGCPIGEIATAYIGIAGIHMEEFSPSMPS